MQIEAEYLRILELEPGHLQLKERMADFLYEEGRTEDARQILLAIVAAYRDEREQLGDAVRVLRHLKAMDSDNLQVREEEAALLEKLGRTHEAAQAWRQLAIVDRRDGNMPRAAEAIAAAAQLEIDHVEAQIEAAEAFEQLDQAERATTFYLQAIELHDRKDQLDQCIPILEQVIRLNPSRLDLPDALARIYERLGQMDHAAHQWLELGELYEESEQKGLAKQVYIHLRTLLPAEMECRRRLARLCENEGDRVGAMRELRELARLAGEAADPEGQADYLMRVLALDAPMRPACASWPASGVNWGGMMNSLRRYPHWRDYTVHRAGMTRRSRLSKHSKTSGRKSRS